MYVSVLTCMDIASLVGMLNLSKSSQPNSEVRQLWNHIIGKEGSGHCDILQSTFFSINYDKIVAKSLQFHLHPIPFNPWSARVKGLRLRVTRRQMLYLPSLCALSSISSINQYNLKTCGVSRTGSPTRKQSWHYCAHRPSYKHAPFLLLWYNLVFQTWSHT